MDPESEEWGYVGRKFFASKLGAPTAAGPFLAAHLKSLMEYPPSQGADTLSMKKALEEAQRKMEMPHARKASNVPKSTTTSAMASMMTIAFSVRSLSHSFKRRSVAGATMLWRQAGEAQLSRSPSRPPLDLGAELSLPEKMNFRLLDGVLFSF
jgi:hypothetical protein